MIPLGQAEKNKLYTIDTIQAEASVKRQLGHLGFIPAAKVILVADAGENSIVLLHNSRLALSRKLLDQIMVDENSRSAWLTLAQLKVGETATVVGIHGKGAVKRRLMDMGITRGTAVWVRKVAPLADPIEINLRNYELTLRKNEAELVLVQKEGLTDD